MNQVVQFVDPSTGFTTIGYFCDEISDVDNVPETLYYVSNGLKKIVTQIINLSNVTAKRDVSNSEYSFEIGKI